MWVVTWQGPGDQAELLLCEDGLAGAEEQNLADGRMQLRLFFTEEPVARELARREQATLQWESDAPPLAYQQEWQPIEVGARFFLRPPWSEAETPAGRIGLIMEPGAVFGSGDHATTQLCLALLEKAVTPDAVVLDAGTGTGILAVAAARLGAARVFAFDYDSEATAMARRACEEAETRVHQWTGSWDSCRAGVATGLCANLPGGLLLDALPSLLPLVRRPGWLVLSGILDEQQEAVGRALAGAASVTWHKQNEWCAAFVRLV